MDRLRQIWRWSTTLFITMSAAGYGTYLATGYKEEACIAMVASMALSMVVAGLLLKDPSMMLIATAACMGALSLSLAIASEHTVGVSLFAVSLYLVAMGFSAMVVFMAKEEPSPTYGGVRFLESLPVGVGPVVGGVILIFLAHSSHPSTHSPSLGRRHGRIRFVRAM